MRMAKIAAALAIAAVFGSSAQALDQAPTWESFRANKLEGVDVKKKGIADLKSNYLDKRCKIQDEAKKKPCRIDYSYMIDRRVKEQQMLQGMADAVALAPAERDRVLRDKFPMDAYLKADAETTRLLDELDRKYPRR